MNPIDILRRVTKPKTSAQAVEDIVKRYGALLRENVSNDDQVAVRRAAKLRPRRKST